MKTLLVFGSEDFEFDNGAVKLIGFLTKQLPGWGIRKLARPEQLMQFIGTDFVILDAAKGVRKPLLITNVDRIRYGRKITAHDMDLSAFLRILKGVGKLKETRIVAVPNDKDPNKFKDEVVELIRRCA